MLWLQAQHKPDAVERPAKSVPVPEQTCFTPRQSDPDPAVSAAHEADGDDAAHEADGADVGGMQIGASCTDTCPRNNNFMKTWVSLTSHMAAVALASPVQSC